MVEVVNLKTCNDWGKDGDVRIDRKTKWGNPFVMQSEKDRDKVCDEYEVWITAEMLANRLNIDELLTAKRLGCWCKRPNKQVRCHGDYLKELIEKRKVGI
jgi:hypothetical protein